MDKRLQHLEHVFRALADPTRLRIVGLLAGGDICVCHIYQTLRIAQPKASRHLAYLRRTGLVRTRRDGLWIHYRLAEPDDSAVGTILNAAVHTLGHLSVARSDEERLKKKVGGRTSRAIRLPVVACCAARSPRSARRRSKAAPSARRLEAAPS